MSSVPESDLRVEPGPGAGGPVAVVHDWLTGMRGGEKVLEAILEMYPDAEIFTLVHRAGHLSAAIEAHRIHTSWVQRLPWSSTRHQLYLPLFPAAVGAFDLGRFPVVISTSHCVAKGAVTRPGSVHVSYCHTPMRYIWDFREQYFGHHTFLPLRMALDVALEGLRLWDVATASRVDHFVANSRTVAGRIAKYYGRTADVVCPPVDLTAFAPVPHPRREAFVILSAFVPYKRLDLALAAVNTLGVPLDVIGDGEGASSLRRLAGPTVRFLGRISAARMADVLANAKALLFPGEEDFGITPLEANASGCPVVAFRAGGATESMVDGRTAVFFDHQEVDSMVAAMRAVDTIPWDPTFMRANAEGYSKGRFQREFRSVMERAVTGAGGRS